MTVGLPGRKVHDIAPTGPKALTGEMREGGLEQVRMLPEKGSLAMLGRCLHFSNEVAQ